MQTIKVTKKGLRMGASPNHMCDSSFQFLDILIQYRQPSLMQKTLESCAEEITHSLAALSLRSYAFGRSILRQCRLLSCMLAVDMQAVPAIGKQV